MNSDIAATELFTDLIGQPSAIALLKAALEKNRVSTAYLFTGAEGVGRRLAALRFLEGLLTNGEKGLRERIRLESRNHPDLLWVEASYLNQGQIIPKSLAEKEGVNKRAPAQIRLEQIRGIARFLATPPIEAPRGMVVIEDIDQMAENAANALLKTLEEPGNGLIIVISARPERLLPTIRSRCQNISFVRLNSKDLEKVLNKYYVDNDMDISLGVNRQDLIKLAGGSPGALISHIKAWESIPKELLRNLEHLPREPIQALSLARDLTTELDFEQQIWLIGWLQQRLWEKAYDARLIRRLEKLRSQLLRFVQPRLAWEIALIEIMPIH